MLSSFSDRMFRLPGLSPTTALILRLVMLGLIDALALQMVVSLYNEGNWFLAGAIVVTLLVVNVINMVPRLRPLRWMTLALGLLVLVALYPLVNTVYISTTNFSDGHRYTKIEAVNLLKDQRYLPEGAVNYYWSPYVNDSRDYALWLRSATSNQSYFATQGEPLQKVIPNKSGEAPFTEGSRQFPDGLPSTIDGYHLAEGPDFFQAMQALDPISGTLKDLRFGDNNNPIGISGRSQAGNYKPRWEWDSDKGILYDNASYVTYKGDVNTGTFVAADGSIAPVDYKVPYDSQDKRRSKADAITLLQKERYLARGAVNYQWMAFKNEAGNYALWLVSDKDGAIYFAVSGQPLQKMESGTEPPAELDSFKMLNSGATMQALSDTKFQTTNFGDDLTPIYVNKQSEAGNYRQRWVYDQPTDTFTDLTQHKAFKANSKTGEFVAADGERAPFGYWVNIGLANYKKALTSTLIDGPLLQIFLWTVAFAFFSVLTAFAVGLLIALLLDEGFPGVRVVRSLLLIPWAIPGMIGILIWRGMLNGRVGVIPSTMNDLFGTSPHFLTDPTWAKFSILLVNLWFAYPYFMLITSGALQSIPTSIYEAAEVDGAGIWDKFWNLTLPLLLVSVGPLLIASFIFNFNNYLLIEGLTEGGPRIPGTNAPPVGYTDNLMTYTYRYAFSANGTRDFGFASAIAVMIFFMVALLTLFQFRLTKRWEEIGENV